HCRPEGQSTARAAVRRALSPGGWPGAPPPVQATPPVGLTGAAQLCDPAVGPGDRDLAVVGGEADLGDARAGRDLAEDLGLQPGRQPDGYQVGARVALLGADHTALDRAVRLIEDGGEQ